MQKRFKCKSCFRNCETTFEVLGGGEGTIPTMCIEHKGVPCNWTPTEAPKLTQDIFETDECPAWAEYAAVDTYGYAYFYSSRPVADLLNGAWYLTTGLARAKPYRGNKFDASDWRNSLIKREFQIPELPEWVYNGEYGYHNEYGYIRFGEIVDWETQVTIMDTGENCYVDNEGFSNGRIVEARKRPLNAEEMLSLIGKVVTKEYGDKFLVTYVPKDGSFLDVGYDISYTPEELVNRNISVDGKPCYKLEHLNEKGEWVK